MLESILSLRDSELSWMKVSNAETDKEALKLQEEKNLQASAIEQATLRTQQLEADNESLQLQQTKADKEQSVLEGNRQVDVVRIKKLEKDLNDKQEHIRQQSSTIQADRSRVRELEKAFTSLNNDIAVLKTSIRSKNDELWAKMTTISAKEQSIQDLEDTNKELRSEREVAIATPRECQVGIKELTKQLANKEESINSLSVRIDELRLKEEAATTQRVGLETKFREGTQEIEELMDSITIKDEELASQSSNIMEKDQHIEELQHTEAELRIEVKSLKHNESRLKSDLDQKRLALGMAKLQFEVEEGKQRERNLLLDLKQKDITIGTTGEENSVQAARIKALETARTHDLRGKEWIWPVADIWEEDFEHETIPASVFRTLRLQMEEWSQKKPDWADGSDRRCAASVAGKKATVWIKKDAKHACSRCTGMGSVCVAVVDGTLELLPLKKPLLGGDGNAADASKDGFWFVSIALTCWLNFC